MISQGRLAWHWDAACKEHPEVNWFPEKGDGHRPAQRICDGCLVAPNCYKWAMEQGPGLEGIWAGTTPTQRRRLRAGRVA